MADVTIKRGDTWPPLRATLEDADGPVDLTAATAVVLKLKSDTLAVRSAPATVEDAVAGAIFYVWESVTTAVAGSYQGEFEVTWGDGQVETFPNDAYFTVEIMEDLG